MLCELGGTYAEKLLPFLYLELIPVKLDVTTSGVPLDDILLWPFDVRIPYYLFKLDCINVTDGKFIYKLKYDGEKSKSMSFCVYHALLFSFIFYLFRRLNKAFELIPYPLILEKIDDLIQGLTSATTTKKSLDYPTFARWYAAVSGKFQENERSAERDKRDPREVELQFMSILEKICHAKPSYFSPLHSTSRSSNIEVTFVFDELDKLATDVDTLEKKGNPDSNESEQHRLNLMKALLSNMKRIITSSEARYIFLGGRLLHDEWLADAARRQPLLTSIFSDQIYLPSLLTDISLHKLLSNTETATKGTTTQNKARSHVYSHQLHDRIEEYFVWQFYLSRIRFNRWIARAWMPFIGLPERNLYTRGFMQSCYGDLQKKLEILKDQQGNRLEIESPLQTIPIRYVDTGDHLNGEKGTVSKSNREITRLKAFIDFLSYRSIGNPKLLNELLASFMVSVDRVVPYPKIRGDKFSCQEVLYLPDHKVFRIQLIARVYRQLVRGFEAKIQGRDDKTITALIYMTDFLFKFHHRAFSWENLELIDELVHMHRGHDLRTLLHELVEHYSDRYLHRIINGMYDFRFRSYFANELDYLSRHSEEEMAAFNFTLDEAQALRDHLEKLVKEKGEQRDKTDILNMLGELHEFYQEYERARYYYRRCIGIRHDIFKEYTGGKAKNRENDEEMALLQALYTNTEWGLEALQTLQHWAPSTLRLYLKIILTYEKEHNDEDALNRCKLCIEFANSMILAFTKTGFEIKKNQINPYFRQKNYEDPGKKGSHVLEYLGILAEPLFTYAWLLEKNPYTSSNSVPVLEDGVKKLGQLLGDNCQSRPDLGYVRSQWQKKLGALCFYKGYAYSDSDKKYIDKAFEYYGDSAKSLAYCFKKHVKTHCKEKLTDTEINVKNFQEVLLYNQFPADFCLYVAECLGDLSESILAKVTPNELFGKNIVGYICNIQNFDTRAKQLVHELDCYFFASTGSFNINNDSIDFLSTKSYLHKVCKKVQIYSDLDLGINLSIASTFYLLRAGQVEAAAREVMHTIEMIAQYMSWYWFCAITQKPTDVQQTSQIFTHLTTKVLWLANFLEWLFIEVRPKVKGEKQYLMGDLIPCSALTSICSIGMSISLLYVKFQNYTIKKSIIKLVEIIELWTGENLSFYDKYFIENNKFNYFNDKLIYSLQRHRYPVLNQLNALKTLVDTSLIKAYLTDNKDDVEHTHAWLQELYQINKQYDHPFHFTPMQTGLSFYLYLYVKTKKPELRLADFKNFDLEAVSRQLLVQSMDMCHSGRAYYKAIDTLYYLYDDFNDNQIHRNHAMQMAGSSLVIKSLGELKNLFLF